MAIPKRNIKFVGNNMGIIDKYTRQKEPHTVFFSVFGVISNRSAISFLHLCSLIIHQPMPKNSLDSVQIGASGQNRLSQMFQYKV